MRKLIKQFMRFGIVGAVCFGIDYGLLIFLTEVGKINYMISGGISFSISVVINYLLSMHFVFVRKKNGSRTADFSAFLVLSISGLGLTEVLMWGIVKKLGISYMLAKIFVTLIVMIYNFITRKIFLEEKAIS